MDPDLSSASFLSPLSLSDQEWFLRWTLLIGGQPLTLRELVSLCLVTCVCNSHIVYHFCPFKWHRFQLPLEKTKITHIR